MRITVFTPTYNRGYIIENLYRSLQKQTFQDFEWIVIDDGSTDDTASQFEKYKLEENFFPIIYERVENGGKHRAINLGIKKARGDLFFIVDSDDYLTETALEKIHEVENSISEQEKVHFAGVCGLKGYSVEKNVGKTFDGDFIDITTLEREKYGIFGDKAEVFYTSVLRQYPFPEFLGEKFLTECVVWDRIAADGLKLRFFNEIVYICDYLPDGLTAHEKELFHRSPVGYGLYLHQSAKYGKLNNLEKWNAYLQYYYQFRGEMPFWKIAKNLHINPVILYLRLFGIRVFYKLYT